MAATYLATDGDIKAILRTLVQSPEFNSRKYFRNKVKTPMEFLASAFRTTATDPANPGAIVNTIKSMGMPLYYAAANRLLHHRRSLDELHRPRRPP